MDSRPVRSASMASLNPVADNFVPSTPSTMSDHGPDLVARRPKKYIKKKKKKPRSESTGDPSSNKQSHESKTPKSGVVNKQKRQQSTAELPDDLPSGMMAVGLTHRPIAYELNIPQVSRAQQHGASQTQPMYLGERDMPSLRANNPTSIGASKPRSDTMPASIPYAVATTPSVTQLASLTGPEHIPAPQTDWHLAPAERPIEAHTSLDPYHQRSMSAPTSALSPFYITYGTPTATRTPGTLTHTVQRAPAGVKAPRDLYRGLADQALALEISVRYRVAFNAAADDARPPDMTIIAGAVADDAIAMVEYAETAMAMAGWDAGMLAEYVRRNDGREGEGMTGEQRRVYEESEARALGYNCLKWRALRACARDVTRLAESEVLEFCLQSVVPRQRAVSGEPALA